MNFPNLNWDAISSTAQDISANSGGINARELTEEGLNAALSSVPFVGGFLTVIAGKLNIAENVGKVMKYGFSSWGASTTPEKIQAQFAENVYPFLIEAQKGLTPTSMGSQLTSLYAEFAVNLDYYRKLRKFHSKAKSTQLANDWAITELQKILASIEELATKLANKGAKVSKTDITAFADDVQILDMIDQDGIIRNGDVIQQPIKLKRFVIDPDSVKGLEVDPDSGEVETKTSLGTIATLGTIAFGIFKAMK